MWNDNQRPIQRKIYSKYRQKKKRKTYMYQKYIGSQREAVSFCETVRLKIFLNLFQRQTVALLNHETSTSHGLRENKNGRTMGKDQQETSKLFFFLRAVRKRSCITVFCQFDILFYSDLFYFHDLESFSFPLPEEKQNLKFQDSI